MKIRNEQMLKVHKSQRERRNDEIIIKLIKTN